MPAQVKTRLQSFERSRHSSGEEHIIATLNSAYETSLERMNKQSPSFRKLAKVIFTWLTFSQRPLTMLELRQALATKMGDAEPQNDEYFLQPIQTIISVCAGLIKIDEASGKIELAHYTASEFFRTHIYLIITESLPRPTTVNLPPISMKTIAIEAHKQLAMVRLTWLAFDRFSIRSCPTIRGFKRELEMNPLYAYAIKYWAEHVRDLPLEDEHALLEVILHFVNDSEKVSAASLDMHATMHATASYNYLYKEKRRPAELPERRRPVYQTTAIHVVSALRLTELSKILLDRKRVAAVLDEAGMNPLHVAAASGAEDIARILSGIDPSMSHQTCGFLSKRNDPFQMLFTPLMLAAELGHTAIVEALWAREVKNGFVETPLKAQLSSTKETVYADLHRADDYSDYFERIRVALRSGITLNQRPYKNVPRGSFNHQEEALRLAAMYGRDDIVLLLLKKGVDPNGVSQFYHEGDTALGHALIAGHHVAVQYLRSYAAEKSTKGTAHNLVDNQAGLQFSSGFPKEIL